MYYLQMKMLNFTYSYNMKLDFIGLGGGVSVPLELPFCIFSGSKHGLIANTVWNYGHDLTKRTFVGLCMVKK